MSQTPSGDLSLPDGYRLCRIGEVDSTSNEVRRLARQGRGDKLWVFAERQSAGKGRQGRNWESLEGNLFASLLLRPACPPARFPELSFVTAVGVAGAFREFIQTPVSCKWPNDVLIGGKKAAGILLEAEDTQNESSPGVVIGIGVNVKKAPEKVDYPACCLNDFVKEPLSKERVFEVLAHKMAGAFARWQNDGFSPLRTLWLGQAEKLGHKIRVESAGKRLEGNFVGLTARGALLLKDFQGKLHEIMSGTVLKDD